MDYSSNLKSFWKQNSQDGLSLKMFQDYLTAMREKISKFSYSRWMNSGIVFHGEFLMQNILEHPSAAEESLLSEVLETEAPLRHFLNKKELKSLIERASARKRPLPTELEGALKAQRSFLSSTPQLEESIQLARKQKASEATEKPTPLIQEEAQTLFVRRMTPSEYEKLQGFPKDWTAVDTGR